MRAKEVKMIPATRNFLEKDRRSSTNIGRAGRKVGQIGTHSPPVHKTEPNGSLATYTCNVPPIGPHTPKQPLGETPPTFLLRFL